MPLDMALPPRRTKPSFTHQWAGASPSNQEACTNFLASPTRWQTAEARRTTTLPPAEWKQQLQKVRQNEMVKEYVPDEGDRTPEEEQSEVETSGLPEKNSK